MVDAAASTICKICRGGIWIICGFYGVIVQNSSPIIHDHDAGKKSQQNRWISSLDFRIHWSTPLLLW
jgi:hypothetical protein